jgi:hypothetical protein
MMGRCVVTNVGNPGVSGNCSIVETGENIEITVYKSNGSFFVMDSGGDNVMDLCTLELRWMRCFDNSWCIALEMIIKCWAG